MAGASVAKLVSAAVLLGALAPAFAGRPLTTDDASILETKRCQVEAWIDHGRSSTDAWAAPACNFGAGIEWEAGFARSRAEGLTRFSESYVQAKALLQSVDDAPWGLGLTIGVARRLLHETYRGWHNPYAIVPLSFKWNEATLHFNAGWSRDRHARRDVTLWGAAAEAPAGERLTLVAEAFGENARRPFLRAGGRYSVAKDILDIDLTVVARPGGTREERFVSAGVFWQSGRFLP